MPDVTISGSDTTLTFPDSMSQDDIAAVLDKHPLVNQIRQKVAHDTYLKPRDPGFEKNVADYTQRWLAPKPSTDGPGFFNNADPTPGDALLRQHIPYQLLQKVNNLPVADRLKALPPDLSEVGKSAILRTAKAKYGDQPGASIQAAPGTLDAQGNPTQPSAFSQGMAKVGKVLSYPAAMVKAAVQPLEASAFKSARDKAVAQGQFPNLGISPSDYDYMQKIANLPLLQRTDALEGSDWRALGQPDKQQQLHNEYQNKNLAGQAVEAVTGMATDMATDPIMAAMGTISPALKAIGLGKAAAGAHRVVSGVFAAQAAEPFIADPSRIADDPVHAVLGLGMGLLAGKHALTSAGAHVVTAFDKQGYVEIPYSEKRGGDVDADQALTALIKAKRPVERVERTPTSVIFHASDPAATAVRGAHGVATSDTETPLSWAKPGTSLFLPDGEQIKIINNSEGATIKVKRENGQVQIIPRQTVKALLDQPKTLPQAPAEPVAATPDTQAAPVQPQAAPVQPQAAPPDTLAAPVEATPPVSVNPPPAGPALGATATPTFRPADMTDEQIKKELGKFSATNAFATRSGKSVTPDTPRIQALRKEQSTRTQANFQPTHTLTIDGKDMPVKATGDLNVAPKANVAIQMQDGTPKVVRRSQLTDLTAPSESTSSEAAPPISSTPSESAPSKPAPPTYDAVVDFVEKTGSASTARISREFKIGYAEAAHHVEQMEDDGIIGPINGSTPRVVYGRKNAQKPATGASTPDTAPAPDLSNQHQPAPAPETPSSTAKFAEQTEAPSKTANSADTANSAALTETPSSPANSAPLTRSSVFEHNGRRYQITEIEQTPHSSSVRADDLTGRIPIGRVWPSIEAFEKQTGQKVVRPLTERYTAEPNTSGIGGPHQVRDNFHDQVSIVGDKEHAESSAKILNEENNGPLEQGHVVTFKESDGSLTRHTVKDIGEDYVTLNDPRKVNPEPGKFGQSVGPRAAEKTQIKLNYDEFEKKTGRSVLGRDVPPVRKPLTDDMKGMAREAIRLTGNGGDLAALEASGHAHVVYKLGEKLFGHGTNAFMSHEIRSERIKEALKAGGFSNLKELIDAYKTENPSAPAAEPAETKPEVSTQEKTQPADSSAKAKRTDVHVTENTGLGGIEIKFDAKPSAEDLAALKAAGFKWSRNKSLWYAKRSAKTVEAAKAFTEGVVTAGEAQPESGTHAGRPAAASGPTEARYVVGGNSGGGYHVTDTRTGQTVHTARWKELATKEADRLNEIEAKAPRTNNANTPDENKHFAEAARQMTDAELQKKLDNYVKAQTVLTGDQKLKDMEAIYRFEIERRDQAARTAILAHLSDHPRSLSLDDIADKADVSTVVARTALQALTDEKQIRWTDDDRFRLTTMAERKATEKPSEPQDSPKAELPENVIGLIKSAESITTWAGANHFRDMWDEWKKAGSHEGQNLDDPAYKRGQEAIGKALEASIDKLPAEEPKETPTATAKPEADEQASSSDTPKPPKKTAVRQESRAEWLVRMEATLPASDKAGRADIQEQINDFRNESSENKLAYMNARQEYYQDPAKVKAHREAIAERMMETVGPGDIGDQIEKLGADATRVRKVEDKFRAERAKNSSKFTDTDWSEAVMMAAERDLEDWINTKPPKINAPEETNEQRMGGQSPTETTDTRPAPTDTNSQESLPADAVRRRTEGLDAAAPSEGYGGIEGGRDVREVDLATAGAGEREIRPAPGVRPELAGEEGDSRQRDTTPTDRGGNAGTRSESEDAQPKPDGKSPTRIEGISEVDQPKPANESTPALAASPSPEYVRPAKAPKSAGDNYVITDRDPIGRGTTGQKAKLLRDAIEALKKIEEDKRIATPEEQQKLVLFPGWGWTGNMLHPKHAKPVAPGKDGYSQHRDYKYLTNGLTPEETVAAERSAQNSHYTTPAIISSMWDAVRGFGFKGGRALEPAAGAGHFIGLVPDDLRDVTRFHAVEKDSLTARILKQLYPQINTQHSPFEKARLADDYFDLAISNVPFGDIPISDSKFVSRTQRPELTKKVHNYFFARSLERVRPGGIIAYITSAGTMDAPTSFPVREYLAEHSDLLGAIRLPNTAFKDNANTEVTTDIIFLRRREYGAELRGRPGDPRSTEAWTQEADVPGLVGSDGNPGQVNEYFLRHPEMVLGTHSLDGKMRHGDGTEYTLKPDDRNLEEALQEAIARLPKDVYKPAPHSATDEPTVFKGTGSGGGTKRVGTLHVDKKGKVFRATSSVDGDGNQIIEPVELDAKQTKIVKGFTDIRDALAATIEAMKTDAPTREITSKQKALKAAYDAYVKAHGSLNGPNRKLWQEDPVSDTILALENGYDSKTRKAAGVSDIFTKRVISPIKDVTSVNSAQDALTVALRQRGSVDLEEMARLSGKTPEQLTKELQDTIFKTPSGRYATKEEYGSGNVVRKLAEAIEAAQSDPSMQKNVEFLQNVQPRQLKTAEVLTTLGAQWIPTDVYRQFLAELMNTGMENVNVAYDSFSGKYGLHITYNKGKVESRTTWGTPEKFAHELFDAALNNQAPKVFDGSGKDRVFNPEKTSLASSKLQEMKAEWDRWVYSDPDRALMLTDKYNKEINVYRRREYDGSHLEFPGMNPLAFKDGLRQHQKNAVWRILQDHNVLLAHEVGTGKTATMQAAGMEMRRIGIRRKPMFLLKASTVPDFADKFRTLYPGAKLLVADGSATGNFHTGRRRQFMARVATGDWDAVLVSHDAFELLAVHPETQQAFFDEKLAALRTHLHSLRDQGLKEEDLSVKEAGNAIDKMEAKLEALKAKRAEIQDDSIYWDDLGVDHLFVDEAQTYKNLQTMSQQPGLSQAGNAITADMEMKIAKLQRDGGGVTFATGTPLTNSVAEMHGLLRYLAPDLLKEQNLEAFDAWIKQYGMTDSNLERGVSGAYKDVARVTKFVNVPELITMYRHIADIVLADDVAGLNRPRLIDEEGNFTDKPILITNSPSKYQKAYFNDMLRRAKEMKPPGHPDFNGDTFLSLTTDGRHVSLDARTRILNAPDDPNSKLSKLANKVSEIYLDPQMTADKRTQIVFMDLGTPGNDNNFNLYADLKRKLVEQGVKPSDVEFVQDHKGNKNKGKLFDKVVSGDVRIIVASREVAGVGVNVQDRLAAIHQVDPTWRPDQLEQADGRILRQGNLFQAQGVRIYEYVTTNSFDELMWHRVKNKAGFIAQVTHGDGDRETEDINGDEKFGFGDIAAVASGNPKFKRFLDVQNAVKKLDLQARAHTSTISELKGKIKSSSKRIPELTRYVGQLEKLRDYRNQNTPEKFSMQINGHDFTERTKAAAALLAIGKDMDRLAGPRRVGTLNGFTVFVERDNIPENRVYNFETSQHEIHPAQATAKVTLRSNVMPDWYDTFRFKPEGEHNNVVALETRLDRIDNDIRVSQEEIADRQEQLPRLKEEAAKPFAKADQHRDLTNEMIALNREIGDAVKNQKDTGFGYEEGDDKADLPMLIMKPRPPAKKSKVKKAQDADARLMEQIMEQRRQDEIKAAVAAGYSTEQAEGEAVPDSEGDEEDNLPNGAPGDDAPLSGTSMEIRGASGKPANLFQALFANASGRVSSSVSSAFGLQKARTAIATATPTFRIKDTNLGETARDNYDGLKNVWGGNLSRLARVSEPALGAARQAASSRAQANVLMRGAIPKIEATLGRSGDWNMFRGALAESRLRGIRQRWQQLSRDVLATPDEDVKAAFFGNKNNPHALLDLIRNITDKRDSLTGADQIALGLAEAKRWPELKTYLSQTFAHASKEVGTIIISPQPQAFEKFTGTHAFKAALAIYKNLVEQPMAQSHENNEGIFSDALGPLDTYYPLTALNADGSAKTKSTGMKPAYGKPTNINNNFATGLAERYDLGAGALQDSVEKSIRSNDKNALIRTLQQQGLVQILKPKTAAPDTITVRGREYPAQVVDFTRDKFIIAGGKSVFVPSQKVVMPDWLRKELRPILEPVHDAPDENAVSKVMSKINAFGLAGLTDASAHSFNLVGSPGGQDTLDRAQHRAENYRQYAGNEGFQHRV